MFKSHILVNEDTDIAAELDKLDKLARRHNLGDAQTLVLMRNAEDVLAELKRQDAETAAYGIKTAIEKSLATDDYDVRFELRPRSNKTSKKSGPLSWLLGS
jgi:hypothetical protein